MARVRALAFLSTLLLFVLLTLRPAHADDAMVRAKVHFENGIHLYDSKPPDYEGALAEFRAAEKEHASPGLKRNIALCLKALHRYGEAVDELNEMLAAGDAVKPETREAGQKMLAELSALIATVRVKIVLHKTASNQGDPAIPHVEVTLDGNPVATEKLGASISVGPGDHTFLAHAEGYGDTTKKVAVVSGDHDVLVQLDLMPAQTGTALGALRVHSPNDRATIAIDGVALANGTWEGALPVGKHHIEARAIGQPAWSRDVDIAQGVRLELEATDDLSTNSTTPPPYTTTPKPKTPEPIDRKWYLQGGLSGFTGTMTMRGGAFASADMTDSDHGYNGISLVAKVGRKMTKNLSLEAWAELGAAKPVSWENNDVTLAFGQLGPELRVHSTGNFRVFAGTGLGLEVDSLTVNPKETNGNAASKGSGVEGVWLLEAGAQLTVLERCFFEAGFFMDVAGDGSIKDNDKQTRYFLDSPWVRGGVRLQFGLFL